MDVLRHNDGGMSFGDELCEVLTQYVKAEKRHGLTPLAFPTGSGKSYAVHRAMAALARDQPEGAAPPSTRSMRSWFQRRKTCERTLYG